MQWICYVEVQGVYAAAARKAGLAPNDRPVVILRDGRVFDGCREAFSSGLVLGAPARQVLRDAPRAVCLELADVDASGHARGWWDRCLSRTPYIEPLELHQLYLSLPAPDSCLTAAIRSEAAELVAAAGEYGFVAFAGIAPSKLVARAAALACKEGWLLRRPGMAGRNNGTPPTTAFVQPGEEERFLAPLPVEYLPGPPEIRRRLNRLGLKTIGEAALISENEWVRQLGALGRQVHQWSRGLDAEPVRPCYPARTLERRVEFAEEVRDRDHLEAVISRHAAVLARQLEGKGEGCQLAALTLERADGPPLTAERTLAKLQQGVYPLAQALRTLLSELLGRATEGCDTPADGWDRGVPVTALTVTLGLIGPMPWQQMDLWDDSGRREREERLERALTLLHERFPARMVGLGPRGDLSWKEQMLQFVDPYRWAMT
ncbi:MAG TPA: hypothetical protein VNT75_00100 [Symbiobacteriaceae bacterium]|nr:hypothetical protein [Symbiobacteriaceae bacterium]